MHARFPAEGRRHRVVAEAGDLGLVGYANVSIWPGNRPGDSYFTLVTAPTFRRQGAGSGLLAYPPFERWQGEIFGNQATLTDGLIIAADGDRIVGLTIV